MGELELVPLHLCPRCRGATDDARLQTVSATDAKRRYRLGVEQLDGLPHVDHWQHEAKQHCRSYLRVDVERRAIAHHGSPAALAELQRKIEARKAKLAATRQRKEDEAAAAREARRAELAAALGARGLTLRDDSVLCGHYVENAAPPLAEVVETMHRARVVWDECNFAARWKAYLERQPWMGWATLKESRRRLLDELYAQWQREHPS
jgi:hypothetical protein